MHRAKRPYARMPSREFSESDGSIVDASRRGFAAQP